MKEKYRIKKYYKGWVVETEVKKWYGKKYWIHSISVAGINSEPWHFESYKTAYQSLRDELKWNVIRNSDATHHE
tara:strand:- start:249 stop:470 length:222 start_codon:yes stop_codon:yes gene_type:complete